MKSIAYAAACSLFVLLLSAAPARAQRPENVELGRSDRPTTTYPRPNGAYSERPSRTNGDVYARRDPATPSRPGRTRSEAPQRRPAPPSQPSQGPECPAPQPAQSPPAGRSRRVEWPRIPLPIPGDTRRPAPDRSDRNDDRYEQRRGGDDDRYDDRYEHRRRDDDRYDGRRSQCGVPGCTHPGRHEGLHKNKGKGGGWKGGKGKKNC